MKSLFAAIFLFIYFNFSAYAQDSAASKTLHISPHLSGSSGDWSLGDHLGTSTSTDIGTSIYLHYYNFFGGLQYSMSALTLTSPNQNPFLYENTSDATRHSLSLFTGYYFLNNKLNLSFFYHVFDKMTVEKITYQYTEVDNLGEITNQTNYSGRLDFKGTGFQLKAGYRLTESFELYLARDYRFYHNKNARTINTGTSSYGSSYSNLPNTWSLRSWLIGIKFDIPINLMSNLN